MRLIKLVQKVILTAIILAAPSVCFGEGPIRFEGPQTIEVGELARINIDGIKGLNDPKIKCIPENSSWEAVQRLDGSPVIVFFTKKAGLYTFIVAGNKDSKTYFESFQVQVGAAPEPLPPPPPPPPPSVAGKYTKRLTSPYMVNPDNSSLLKLIGIYQSVAGRAGEVQTYKQLETALAKATGEALGQTALRGVRDEAALILQTDLAPRNAVQYDPVATSNVFNELAKSLTPLLEK